jgi:hypothetical protein
MTESFSVFTLLGPKDIEYLGGIPGKAIVGLVSPEAMAAGRITPSTFRPNPEFADVLHSVIETWAPESRSLQDEARRIEDGAVFVIDLRTPTPLGEVPPEDILGQFEAKAGFLVRNSYHRNPNHLLVSERGPFQLDKPILARLLDALRSLPPE